MPCPEAGEINNNTIIRRGMTGLMTPETLCQNMDHNKDGLLILDCRSPNEYNSAHIIGALHVALPSIMQRRLLKGSLHVSSVISSLRSTNQEELDIKLESVTLVLYDESTDEIRVSGDSVMSILLRLLSEDGFRVCMLQGGFMDFSKTHSNHCQLADNPSTDEGVDTGIFGLRNLRIVDNEDEGNTPTSCDPFPVKVMEYLYLGNAKNSADLDLLNQHEICYIVNVTANVPNTFTDREEFHYLQIPISDHWSQNLSAFFPKAIKFIEEARQQKKGVLVHCLAGISRSVTVTVAFLMQTLKLTLNDAYDYVKRINPNISPNFNFMGQLLEFERTIHGVNLCQVCQERKDHSEKDQLETKESEGASSPLPSTLVSAGQRCTCEEAPKCYFSSPITSTPESVQTDTVS